MLYYTKNLDVCTDNSHFQQICEGRTGSVKDELFENICRKASQYAADWIQNTWTQLYSSVNTAVWLYALTQQCACAYIALHIECHLYRLNLQLYIFLRTIFFITKCHFCFQYALRVINIFLKIFLYSVYQTMIFFLF